MSKISFKIYKILRLVKNAEKYYKDKNPSN